MSGSDAVEFLLAGAVAVQVGTLNFLRPDAGQFVLDGMIEHMSQRGISSLTGLSAAVHS
jgi:dihydroorotate dehydrogenase (NAD+) catalytic subunit